MEINYWAGTDVGRKRSDNEDNFLIDKRLRLFVVADGMGGHASGEIASAMAVHGIRDVLDQERDILDVYDDDDPKSHVEVCTLLEYAVHYTCAQIFEKARREPEKRGMGTTLVVLLIIGARGFIAYVGDSRIYLLRGGIVYQLTEDHSLKNELIRMGKISAEEFDTSPYANLKNAMTRAVGVYESVEVDTLDFDIIPGDSFMLCSDGLYEYLSDEDIANAIGLPELREVPGMLIDSANQRGGKDNITSVVVQVAGDEDETDRAAELNFTLDTLKTVPLFRELSYQQLVRVMNLAKQSAVAPGQQLFTEGEQGHELIVLLRGRVALTRDGVLVAEIEAGAHLGEMSLIDASVRSASAVASEPGKILSIARDDFYQVLRREPALAVKLLWSFVRVLADRLRQTTTDLAEARSQASQFPDLTELAEEAARSAARLPIIHPDDMDDVDLDKRPTLIPTTVIAPAPTAEAPVVRAGRSRPTLIRTTTNNVAPGADEPRQGGRQGHATVRDMPAPTYDPSASVVSSANPPRPPSGPRPTTETVVAPGGGAPRPESEPRSGDTVATPPVPPPAPQRGPVITGDTLAPPGQRPRVVTPAPTGATPLGRPSMAGRGPANTGNTVVPPSAGRTTVSGPTTSPPAGRPPAPRRATQSVAKRPSPVPVPEPASPELDAPRRPATRSAAAAPQAAPSGTTVPASGPSPAAPSGDTRSTQVGVPIPRVPPPPPTSPRKPADSTEDIVAPATPPRPPAVEPEPSS